MGKEKTDANDLRRMIGYCMVSFMGVFLYLPIVWFIHLFSQEDSLYWHWIICSVILAAFNVLFYYWRYPEDWLRNLLCLVAIDLLIMLFEYFWLIQSMS